MSRREFGTTFAWGMLGAALAPAVLGKDAGGSGRPNLVLMIADNLGKESVGCYGGTRVATRHIDSLARDGVTFDRCYIGTPLCCPARAGMMTGRFPQCMGLARQPSPGNPDEGLPAGELTLGRVLQDVGYRTAVFGKWNLGYDPKFLPVHRGFDTYYGINAGHADYYTHVYDRDGRKYFYRDATRIDPEGYVDNLCTDEAVGFIHAQADSEKPFFVWHAFFTPHGPYQAPPGYPSDRGIDATYGFMIENMDRNVGRILAALEETGAAQNTLVVFISDQGASRWNSYRRDLTEGGLQVVCLARWPGHTVPGLRIRTPVISYDWFTTFAAAGRATPLPPDAAVFGRDISHLFRGEGRPPHDALFWSYGGEDAIREGRWKLLLQKDGTAALYDLFSDPEGKKDVSAEHPDRVEAMRARLLKWKRDPCGPHSIDPDEIRG